MTEPILTIFEYCLLVLAIALILALLNGVQGQRFTDRVVALNVIGTLTIVISCMLAVYLQHSYILDIAMVLALLNFLAVVVLCRMAILRRVGRMRVKKERAAAAEEGEK